MYYDEHRIYRMSGRHNIQGGGGGALSIIKGSQMVSIVNKT